MEKTRTQSLEEILSRISSLNPDIEGAGIISSEGLIIASALPPEANEDNLAAMSGALLSLGERAGRELNRGELEQIYIRGKQGYAVLSQAGQNAILVVLALSSAKLGMLFLDIRRAASEIAQIL